MYVKYFYTNDIGIFYVCKGNSLTNELYSVPNSIVTNHAKFWAYVQLQSI